MHRLAYSKPAVRQLARMPRPLARRIRDQMVTIASGPYARHPDVKPLRARDGFRLRVGNWRVTYEVREEALLVLVLTIDPRGQVYR
jgi:mRNA interferase RelE/StbE